MGLSIEVYIYIILIVIIIALLVLTFVPMPITSVSVQNKGPYNLNNSTNIFNSNTFQNNNDACIQGFFYLENLKKTGIATPCTTGTTDPSLPNCNTGRYELCSCDGTDCSPCYHKGYIQLMNINEIITLEALGAPDASRQGRASVQLTIKTQSSGNDASADAEENPYDASGNSTSDTSSFIFVETFVLPPLPFNKWIMITINRSGRRYDIYYNDTLVLSKYTSSILYPNNLYQGINVGDSKVDGSCGFFNLYPYIMSAISIKTQYENNVTTRGSPLFDVNPGNTASSFGPISLDRINGGLSGLPQLPSLCSGSDCISSPSVNSAKPYYEWTSQMA